MLKLIGKPAEIDFLATAFDIFRSMPVGFALALGITDCGRSDWFQQIINFHLDLSYWLYGWLTAVLLKY